LERLRKMAGVSVEIRYIQYRFSDVLERLRKMAGVSVETRYTQYRFSDVLERLGKMAGVRLRLEPGIALVMSWRD
jgi:hypothetical protein